MRFIIPFLRRKKIETPLSPEQKERMQMWNELPNYKKRQLAKYLAEKKKNEKPISKT